MTDSPTFTGLRRQPRRSVVWMARVFSVGVSLGLGLGAAEVFLRLQARAGLTSGPVAAQPDPQAAGLQDIEGIFALAVPNQRARYRGALYTTNSRGVRGPEYSLEKAPNSFRIEVIGDSVTMGSGVRADQAYPGLLEAALNNTGDPRHYQVMNLGLAGLSFAGSLDVRLLKFGLDYNPDMIIYGFTHNDLEGPDYQQRPLGSPKSSGSRVIDLLHDRWDYTRDVVWPSKSSYVRELDNNYFHNPPVWQRFEADLDRLAAVARERGICVVVLVHTRLDHLTSWHPYLRHYAAVAEAARARGFFVVDSFPWFDGMDPDRLVCGVFDSHPNALGHQILFEALLSGLRTIPAKCWAPR